MGHYYSYDERRNSMSNYRGTAGSVGTATHPTRPLEIFKNNNKCKRKSKYKCVYYHSLTHDCTKLNIECVGPSNALCKYYCDHLKEEQNSVERKVNKGEDEVKKPFEGIKTIKMNEISLGNKYFSCRGKKK